MKETRSCVTSASLMLLQTEIRTGSTLPKRLLLLALRIRLRGMCLIGRTLCFLISMPILWSKEPHSRITSCAAEPRILILFRCIIIRLELWITILILVSMPQTPTMLHRVCSYLTMLQLKIVTSVTLRLITGLTAPALTHMVSLKGL